MNFREFSLILAFAYIGVCSCSGSVTTPNGDIGQKETLDREAGGDGMLNLVDVEETGGEAKIETTEFEAEIPSCQDQCQEGQIKCLSANKYKTCQLQEDGCWKWYGKTYCKSYETCTCFGQPDNICIPDKEPCICIPDCEEKGKVCGDDGCGGSCGECTQEGYVCQNYQCVPKQQCESECAEGETKCSGPLVQFCKNVSQEGEEPCWLFGQPEPCPENQICGEKEGKELCVCEYKSCMDTCCASEDYVCFPEDTCCLPNCSGKECGSDGCGGLCADGPGDGGCPQGLSCVAGECTSCPQVSECDPNQITQVCDSKYSFVKCEEVPDCPGIYKWSSVSYPCGVNEECDQTTGQCKCVPQCQGKQCGDDGCGGTCGECTQPYVCNETTGQCECTCEGEPENPVCDPETGITYANTCEAECAGVVDYEKGDCQTNCQTECSQEELEPQEICGIDGKTYDNFCQLKCAIGSEQCTSLQSCPQIKYLGQCILELCETCADAAPFYDPVCAEVDGQYVTFYNECDWKACQGQPPLYCNGECPDPDKCPACDDTCAPVCGKLPGLGGETYKTYLNECFMECEGAQKVDDSPCCMQCVNQPVEWLCSSAYKVYKNQCYLTCKAPQETPSLYTLPQLPDGSIDKAVCTECQCDLSVKAPVCGEDYFTYVNECHLQCAKQQGYVASGEPICVLDQDKDTCNFDTCPCPIETGGQVIASELQNNPWPMDTGKRGVCGIDGNTYGNICSATYFGVSVLFDQWCDECAELCAGQAYEPVCCQDHVTYPNLCIPSKCNTNLDTALCSKGQCCFQDTDCDDGNPETTDICSESKVCEYLE